MAQGGEARRVKRAGGVAADLPASAQALFDQLRAWRADAARRHGVPAYVVFHDATLKEIAALKPASLKALRGISGIGEKKLAAYADEIIGVSRRPDAEGRVRCALIAPRSAARRHLATTVSSARPSRGYRIQGTYKNWIEAYDPGRSSEGVAQWKLLPDIFSPSP
jgi:ribonuclease D